MNCEPCFVILYKFTASKGELETTSNILPLRVKPKREFYQKYVNFTMFFFFVSFVFSVFSFCCVFLRVVWKSLFPSNNEAPEPTPVSKVPSFHISHNFFN